ncbi:hypothetical protein IFM89_008356 [Coptis chinensis]|uniref:Uncharacterized protein n=1 Tax=Coptis chinensis TaxID=261450 RepID=A0A835M4C1_9MAGN|nr:hypothetical protein IFM89_008356 [Coptis chinensis]
MASEEEIQKGYKAVTAPTEEEQRSQISLSDQFKALADMKFSYVATCQNNPSLRVAYIDEVEESIGGCVQIVYYSVLVKAVDNLEQALGLLDDDSEWDDALKEASGFQSPKALCELFVTLMLKCEISFPEKLWKKHHHALVEDILYRYRRNNGN